MQPAATFLYRRHGSANVTKPGPAIGVDEVGRGAAAGPVVVCAARLRPETPLQSLPTAIRDSKKLTRRARSRLAPVLTDAFDYRIAALSADAIDAIGIRQATLHAMARACRDLDPGAASPILIDGVDIPDELRSRATALPRADGQIVEVAAAAIIAKVLRDGLMGRLHLRHPEYGWDRNAGYLTPAHRAGLETRGASAHHRTTFIKNHLPP